MCNACKHSSNKSGHHHAHSSDDGCGCGCHHGHGHHQNSLINKDTEEKSFLSTLKTFLPEISSLILMIASILINWGNSEVKFIAFIVSILPVGIPILISTLKEWAGGDFFNEFTLMILACVGAFCLGEYPEAVAILLFYSIGEKLEEIVSGDVRNQIKKLIGKMPTVATALREGNRVSVKPEDINIDEIILVKPGENVPLDGILQTEGGVEMNSSALTGESVPVYYESGSTINSGLIPINKEIELKVTNLYKDSSLSKILQLIEDASAKRAPSERILRKITKWYTPIVFTAAVLLVLIPWIISLFDGAFLYHFDTWFNRSLIFLVCSCPCALIVSIPLSYFSSIGIASKKGILFKGHDSLDTLRKVNSIFFDKTGTITTGRFHVEKIEVFEGRTENEILTVAASIEQSSSHPLATAILEEFSQRKLNLLCVENVITENHGITARIGNHKYILGSALIMNHYQIKIDDRQLESTNILVVEDNILIGIIYLSDTLKSGVEQEIANLHKSGIESIGILSGDNSGTVNRVKNQIGADFGVGELLPADKEHYINKVQDEGKIVAFAGDGINDAPSLAKADVGIAMGTLGTDMAIQSAQVVIVGDDLSKINEGIKISRRVNHIVLENVTFAFGIKLAVMILGAFGIATLWAAVFADTGVTAITVLWTLWRLRVWEIKKTK